MYEDILKLIRRSQFFSFILVCILLICISNIVGCVVCLQNYPPYSCVTLCCLSVISGFILLLALYYISYYCWTYKKPIPEPEPTPSPKSKSKSKSKPKSPSPKPNSDETFVIVNPMT